MVYIVPYYRMTEDICRVFCDNFEQVSIHRFLDGEFKKFKQVVVMGLRRHRADGSAEAETLCEAASHPERLPTLDTLEAGRYTLPASPLKVENFRGAEFNEDELARQLRASSSFDRLFATSKLDSEPKSPPLPLSIGQVGLIGGSGLINGLMECEYPHIIKGRISATTQDKSKGLAVPYVTNRAIQNRLDSTVGIDGWQNEFKPWKDGKAQLCGISIYFQQQKQWLTKWDGADDSDFESVKGGLSDSMKRAAVEWGVGRYLYGMTQIWVKVEQRGKSFFIVDEGTAQAGQDPRGLGTENPVKANGASAPGTDCSHRSTRNQRGPLPGVRRVTQAHRQRTVPNERPASEGQRPEIPGIYLRSGYQAGPRYGHYQCESDQPEQRRHYLLCSGRL